MRFISALQFAALALGAIDALAQGAAQEGIQDGSLAAKEDTKDLARENVSLVEGEQRLEKRLCPASCLGGCRGRGCLPKYPAPVPVPVYKPAPVYQPQVITVYEKALPTPQGPFPAPEPNVIYTTVTVDRPAPVEPTPVAPTNVAPTPAIIYSTVTVSKPVTVVRSAPPSVIYSTVTVPAPAPAPAPTPTPQFSWTYFTGFPNPSVVTSSRTLTVSDLVPTGTQSYPLSVVTVFETYTETPPVTVVTRYVSA